MDKDAFKTMGYQIIDWIADYMENGYDGPVQSQTEPGDVLALLPEHPPQHGEDLQQSFADFQRLILPNLLHWNDPRFFGYFPCNNSGPAILGDLLASGLNVNAMSWATSPAATELEIRVMAWLGEMIGLSWPGCFQDTASSGTFCALLAARERKHQINQEGFYQTKPLTVYASEHAHSSVLKAARMAGIGDQYFRMVPGDDQYRLDVNALETMIAEDLKQGYEPLFVSATVGTTSSTAIDPVPAIAALCGKHNIWLHVDAALAGSAAILPEMSWLMDGVDQADSFLFNPHKWLFVNFDCCAFFCKDPLPLKKALAIQPEYLKSQQDAKVENFRDWITQLGRSFRALKAWFTIRAYGVEGLREKLRLHLKMTQWLAERIEEHPALILAVKPEINTVCFRMASDEETETLMREINASGQAFLSHTKLSGRYVIRVAFGQTQSTFAHAEQLWQLINALLEKRHA